MDKQCINLENAIGGTIGAGVRLLRADRMRIRVLPDEVARWRLAARQQGAASLSGWLRSLADQAVATGGDPLAWRADLTRFSRDLNSGLGNNLQQIARAAAQHGCGDRQGAAPLAVPTASSSLATMAEDLARMRAELGRVLRPSRRRRTNESAASLQPGSSNASIVVAPPAGDHRS